MFVDSLSYQISKLWRRIKVTIRHTDRAQVLRTVGILLVAFAVLGTSPPEQNRKTQIVNRQSGEEQGVVSGVEKEDATQQFSPHRLPDSPPLFAVSATAAHFIDSQTGTVLYEKNANEKLPLASLTKVMTAVVVLDEFPLDEIVTVPELCTYLPPPKVGLAPGQKLTVEELLYGMLVASAADASCALSHHYEGDFLELMNRKAEELGLSQTHFENEIGWDGENGGHFSTARNLVKLSQEALKNGVFRKIVGTAQWQNLTSTNELLFTLPGTTGIKTGYTDEAKGCLAVSYERDGHEVIGVILGSDDRFLETQKILNRLFKVYQF